MRWCFTLQVKTNRLDEYTRRHAAVWPEMLDALRAAGWRNYSLWLREDGLLVGVVEADDLAAAQRAMDATAVNGRWQAEMAEFMDTGGRAPDRSMQVLREVFHLD
ncbi:L-rhamnose mutarotase [Nakamurella leprariae]|uniref:L-rhamnose mutarotase n=1 Tax=Nakamurella leprariae TaxID=2803911 RepID=A0A938YES4_9ACTN|nr:L-rhamnose mutarotase [Nakamurella leprariae]MBM9468268.1 L-rhamnose mutarotase [Nakamurella leprariae]